MAETTESLDLLEAEAMYVFREVAAQFDRAAILFSGGKDSITLVHLAAKSFWPSRIPFPVLHIDTGHNFPETMVFRDAFVQRMGVDLLVGSVQATIDQGKVVEETGPHASRNLHQTVTLLDAIAEHRLQAAIGGARRDEEKARAKERVFSLRDGFGHWNPKSQRPELWNLYNGRIHPGEHMRVFPLSNWTELDIWRYIEREQIEVPSIYFAHKRTCVRTAEGTLLAHSPFFSLAASDAIVDLTVRCRTVGDMSCTGVVQSQASTVREVIEELVRCERAERSTRADDLRSDNAMEDRKREGYF